MSGLIEQPSDPSHAYMKSDASKHALAICQLMPSSGKKIGVASFPWLSCRQIGGISSSDEDKLLRFAI